MQSLWGIKHNFESNSFVISICRNIMTSSRSTHFTMIHFCCCCSRLLWINIPFSWCWRCSSYWNECRCLEYELRHFFFLVSLSLAKCKSITKQKKRTAPKTQEFFFVLDCHEPYFNFIAFKTYFFIRSNDFLSQSHYYHFHVITINYLFPIKMRRTKHVHTHTHKQRVTAWIIKWRTLIS